MYSSYLRLIEVEPANAKVAPQAGYFFSYQIRGVRYLGKILRDDIKVTCYDDLLMYFFRPASDMNKLSADDLLIPPIFIQTEEWQRGAFKLEFRDEEDFELENHAFILPANQFSKGPRFVDERCNRVNSPAAHVSGYDDYSLEILELYIGIALGLADSREQMLALPLLAKGIVPVKSHTYELKLPHTELEALDLESDELEDALLANRKLSKLAELIEAGSSETERHFVFDVPPRRRKGFLSELQLELKARGVRNYKVINCDTGEQVV